MLFQSQKIRSAVASISAAFGALVVGDRPQQAQARTDYSEGYSPTREAARETADNDLCARWFLRGELTMLGALGGGYLLMRFFGWLLS